MAAENVQEKTGIVDYCKTMDEIKDLITVYCVLKRLIEGYELAFPPKPYKHRNLSQSVIEGLQICWEKLI